MICCQYGDHKNTKAQSDARSYSYCMLAMKERKRERERERERERKHLFRGWGKFQFNWCTRQGGDTTTYIVQRILFRYSEAANILLTW